MYLECYQAARRKAAARLISAAFLHGFINKASEEIDALTTQASQETDLQKQREALAQVMELQRKAKNALGQLQAIERGRANAG